MTASQRLQNANTAKQIRERQALNGWTPTEKPLSAEESAAYQSHEEVIARNLKAFQEVGMALLDIRDRRLYRAEYKTFEEYCRERWGMRRDYADKLIAASEVVSNFHTNSMQIPTRETHVRPLTSLEPDDQRLVWDRVTNSGDKITEARVQAEVELLHAPAFLKDAVDSGLVGIKQIPSIAASLKGVHAEVIACAEKWSVTDPATIDILKGLHKRGADTFMEIFDSGYIQPGDEEEAVSITASSLMVQRAIDLKAKIHKQMAADTRRQARQGVPLSSDAWQLVEADFRDACRAMSENSISAIITDPPYPYEYVGLYGGLAEAAARILKPGGSLIAMCGQSYLPEIMALMTPHLTYRWTFAYMTPGAATQIFPRTINCSWKPVLWFVKGDYTGTWHGDVFNSPRGEKSHHEWQQSEGGMDAFIERFSMPGDIVLDPFCGAGTTGVCAIRQGRNFIGIDTDKSALEASAERLLEASAKGDHS